MRTILFLFAVLFSVAGYGQQQMLLRGEAAVIGPVVPPLDTYSADAAFSFRLLRTAYAGSCIRVRRASDGVEQNIGFDGSGLLDTVALQTFIGGSYAEIATWYDQSGNGQDGTVNISEDAYQITEVGGAIKRNPAGQIAAYNSTSDAAIFILSIIFSESNFHEIRVGAHTALGDNYLVFARNNTANPYYWVAQDGSTSTTLSSLAGTPVYRKNGNPIAGTINRQVLYDAILEPAAIFGIQNVLSTNFTVWASEYSSSGALGGMEYVSEIILLPASVSISAIENNANNYYSIY